MRYYRFKRAVDVALSILGLVGLAPLAVLIAIIIKLDSLGPVIFAQERLGLRRATFKCLKFRTMRDGAQGTSWTEIDDARVTRVGCVLRRWRLDELPQLVNVLRGEMSIVGPRPIIESEADMFGAFEPPCDVRFEVLPGITGLAQATYKYPVTRAEHHEKFRLDVEYVASRSLWLDLQIMFLTVGVLMRPDCLRGKARRPWLRRGPFSCVPARRRP